MNAKNQQEAEPKDHFRNRNDPHRKTIPILKSENDPHINFGQIQKRKMTPIYILGNNLKESDPQTGNGCHTKTQLYKNDLYNFYL